MSLIPDIPPKAFSFSAVIVGYLLLDDLSANEQNALGNWLMLTAQVLCTNAWYKQLQTERKTAMEVSDKDTVIMLEKMIKALQKEIDNLKASH